jgi:hypothetical protein
MTVSPSPNADAARAKEPLPLTWHPMETAPRDGSKFWGLCDGDAVTMFWHEGLGVFCSSFRRMEMAPGYTVDGQPFKDHSPVEHRPSRWMPLPQ